MRGFEVLAAAEVVDEIGECVVSVCELGNGREPLVEA